MIQSFLSTYYSKEKITDHVWFHYDDSCMIYKHLAASIFIYLLLLRYGEHLNWYYCRYAIQDQYNYVNFSYFKKLRLIRTVGIRTYTVCAFWYKGRAKGNFSLCWMRMWLLSKRHAWPDGTLTWIRLWLWSNGITSHKVALSGRTCMNHNEALVEWTCMIQNEALDR